MPRDDPRPALFAALWACATLFHQFSFSRVGDGAVELGLSATAVGVLLVSAFARRWTGRALLVLAVVQLVEIGVRLPHVSNHWMTTGFVAAAIVVARIRTPDASRWYERFAPALRWLVVVLYFYGVFHKLNTDFLRVETSCGARLYRSLATDALPGLPLAPGVLWTVIVGTLVVETAIPILLVVRQTRRWGVVLAAAFHFVLAIVPFNVYYNFTSMLLGLFFAFMSEDDARWLRDRYARIPARAWRALAIAALVFTLGRALDGGRDDAWLSFARAAWVAYGGVVLVGLIAWARAKRGETAPPLRWRLDRILVIVPALYMVNGASPYLGLKTENSLSMYSNLRTEEGRSNHLLVRRTAAGLGHHLDTVEILESDDATLRRLRRRDQGMTWFEFRDHLVRHPDVSVRFRRNHGPVERVSRAGVDPRFSSPTGPLERKLLRYRPSDLRIRHRCTH